MERQGEGYRIVATVDVSATCTWLTYLMKCDAMVSLVARWGKNHRTHLWGLLYF